MYKQSIKVLKFICSLIGKQIKKFKMSQLPLLFFILAATFMYFFNNITCADEALSQLVSTTTKGNSQIKLFYENQHIDEFDSKYQIILKENIIHMERHCESLFKCFPSGLLTPFAWMIGGVAVRHEYVVVQTTNHIATIELKQQKGDYTIQIQLYDYDKNFLQFLQKERKWDRSLMVLKSEDIGKLQFSQLHQFLGTILVCWGGINMFKKGKYDVLFKNCKSLSKAICFFSMNQSNIDNIMQSILGLYTDHFCDFVERKEIQWILDFVYDQTVSGVTKIKTIMNEIVELRNRYEIIDQIPNWEIL